MESLITIVNNLVSEGQKLLPFIVGGAFLVGAFLHATGGREGLQKAKNWYVGGTVGLIIGLGANAIVSMLQSQINF